MGSPSEQQWQRVEQLAEELADVPQDQLPARLAALEDQGETSTVLTLLAGMMSLPPPPTPIGAGDLLGTSLKLIGKLGAGGMGTVWRAHEGMIERDVALKLIHPALATPTLTEHFLREMKALGQLVHPGIVRIYYAGVHLHTTGESLPFFTMELIEGQPLLEWAAAHRQDRAALLEAGCRICDALQAAHERQVVHRDLKPANILVRPDGQPVVLDFGIARIAGTAFGDAAGSFTGTPAYAAPEQHLGRDLDFRSGESVDVYALGLILFEMLAGSSCLSIPKHASVGEIRRAVLEGPVARLADTIPDCPDFLDELVARAVRRDPVDRFYSMAELGRGLRRAAGHYAASRPVEPPWRPGCELLVPGTSWRLADRLGEGGAGEVWLAIHATLGTRRVFKFCDSEEKARSLRRELSLYRLLKERVGTNPHFIPLHDISLNDPPWYLLMEAVEAVDLIVWAGSQPGGLAAVPLPLRIEIVAQAAEALNEAHNAGIIHRDVKPANLLVGRPPIVPGSAPPSPETVHVYVADFGIGQLVAEGLRVQGTRMGFTRTVLDLQPSGAAGTMMYLAPEVLEGAAATARSDVYSLGVVLWQLLVGNLATALDATTWRSRVGDELLEEDLARCLAGDPARRWNSAGEFASRLRTLPARRERAAREQAERQHAERTAYRRGILRASLYAGAVIALLLALSWIALRQRQAAVRNAAQVSLQRAGSLHLTDPAAGRRRRGLDLLEGAVAKLGPSEAVAARSAAAMILGLPELIPAGRNPTNSNTSPAATAALAPDQVARQPDETVRKVSTTARLIAVARTRDEVQGIVELYDRDSGTKQAEIRRDLFPWVPIAESALLQFNADGSRIAVGGAETSRQVLLCRTSDGAVESYLYHGTDPLSVAWHPAGRLLAVGGADNSVRLWDRLAAVSAITPTNPAKPFALPPRLDVPAIDLPAKILDGHRGRVLHLAFNASGRWLASLDDAGYLRIHSGFSRTGLPGWSETDRTNGVPASPVSPDLHFAVERRIADPKDIADLQTTEDSVSILHRDGTSERLGVDLGELPAEWEAGYGLHTARWNSDGSMLCIATDTDVIWLQRSPLSEMLVAHGSNPSGIAGDPFSRWWIAPSGRNYRALRPIQSVDGWRLESFPAPPSTGIELPVADRERGTRTAITTPGDGRVAIYHGRAIRFLREHKLAPNALTLGSNPLRDEFQSLHWDTTGRLLFGLFSSTNRQLQVQAWVTSTNFPPTLRALPTRSIEPGVAVPANDGRHLLLRSPGTGLVRIAPEDGNRQMIDASQGSRQLSALAASTDGKMLAMVVDRTTLEIRRLPDGEKLAELHSRRRGRIIGLSWAPTGNQLATLTEDGWVQAWNLTPWQHWLSAHHLAP